MASGRTRRTEQRPDQRRRDQRRPDDQGRDGRRPDGQVPDQRRRDDQRRESPPPEGAGRQRPGAPRGWWVRFRESSLATQVAIGVTVAAVLGAAAAIVPQLADGAAVKDRIRAAARGDGDLRTTVQYIDGGYDLILPAGATLTDSQRRMLRDWSGPAGLGSEDSPLQRLVAQLRAAGAADPNVLTLRITLEGRRNQPVRVDAIEAVDVRRQPVPQNILLSIPPQGPSNTIRIMLNLDDAAPAARTAVPVPDGATPTTTQKDGVRPGPPYFRDNTLTVADAEEDAIVVQAIAARQAVSFAIRVSYRLGDQRRAVTIDNAGHPFAVAPMHCTDPSPFVDGHLGGSGHVAYREIWQMRSDLSGADPVADPGHHPMSFPYC